LQDTAVSRSDEDEEGVQFSQESNVVVPRFVLDASGRSALIVNQDLGRNSSQAAESYLESLC
jgi:hypothetical protein